MQPFTMAEAREHNNSPMPGVARNNDPALDIAREHQHEHVHHSAHAAPVDNTVYTTGTTNEKSNIPTQTSHDSHLHHRHLDEKPGSDHDIEKSGGYNYEVEKATHSTSDPEPEVDKRKWYTSLSVFYRKFRLPIHLYLAFHFTG